MILINFIRLASLSKFGLYNFQRYYNIQNDLVDSTLFQHNKILYPIVLPNFENLDLNYLESHSNQRQCKVDFNALRKLMDEIKTIDDDLNALEEKKIKFMENFKITLIVNDESKDIRQKIKILKSKKLNMKDELTLSLLSIPNMFFYTPNENWFSIPTSDEIKLKNEIKMNYEDLSNDVNIQYNDTSLKYIDGNLAIWKYKIMESGYDWWIQAGYVPIALSDISKTVVVECFNKQICTNNIGIINSKISNEETNIYNVLFLKGSGSIESFCSYFMRTRTNNKSLPVKLMTLGNSYRNKEGSVGQTSIISIFIAETTQDKLMTELIELQTLLKRFWRNHFDISLVTTSIDNDNLQHWENYRHVITSEQSNSEPLASVSIIGDYISRRLIITDTSDNYLHMAYAEVLNFDSILSFIRLNRQSVTYKYDTEWLDFVE